MDSYRILSCFPLPLLLATWGVAWGREVDDNLLAQAVDRLEVAMEVTQRPTAAGAVALPMIRQLARELFTFRVSPPANPKTATCATCTGYRELSVCVLCLSTG